MKTSRRFRLGLFAAAAAVLAFVAAGPEPALAAKKTCANDKLGFKIRIEDSYVQVPPKTTSDESYKVGEWYEDAAKFDAGYLRPTFEIYWFAEPKGQPAPPPTPPPSAAEEGADGAEPSKQDRQKAMREAFRPKSLDEALDRLFQINERLFGEFVPMEKRWASAEKDKTVGKIALETIEINAPSKKKADKEEREMRGYAFVARLTLDRPKETIRVGFFGSCSVNYVKRFRTEFPALARSFEELKSATDSRNEGAQADLSKDPKARREQVRKTKLIPGWKCIDTENYILLHHDEVEPSLVRSIGTQIEAIRAQIYEVRFPPDRPITDVSIVRVCKDRDQYMQYGGMGGSAGYWSSYHEELVFFEDKPKEDSLRVLYHEAFHQYIYYSVGDIAPHSWFNEGHGDFFAGHNYAGGKFVPDVFSWRVSEAKEWKRNPTRPPLREWINWTQREYLGGNKANVPGGANYALGWSLVYFLRTTKKPAYQGVLDRYFNSLKGSATRAREADAAWTERLKEYREKHREWQEKVKSDPDLPEPQRPERVVSSTDDIGNEETWKSRANKDAFDGIDWDAIEKDWLNAPY